MKTRVVRFPNRYEVFYFLDATSKWVLDTRIFFDSHGCQEEAYELAKTQADFLADQQPEVVKEFG